MSGALVLPEFSACAPVAVDPAAAPVVAPAQPEMTAEAPVTAESPTTTRPASPPMAAETPEAAEPEVEVARAPASGSTAASDDDVPTTMAPKLQSVDGAVIIRRGDTLWRISRRVYGRGIRYSTIYLANQKQIEDPDRIWPGQVFTVPEKTKEGVEADLSRMGDQATTVPQ